MKRIARWGGRALLGGGRGRRAARGRRRRRFAALAVYLVATVIGGGQLLRGIYFGGRAEWLAAGAALVLAAAAFGLAGSIGTRLGTPPRAFLSWLVGGAGRR